MKYLSFLLLFGFLLISSCGENQEEEEERLAREADEREKIRNQIGKAPAILECLRWIDRDLYFALPDPILEDKNNEFNKLRIQDIIDKMERNTRLGEDYFRIRTVNPDLLNPFQRSGLAWSEYKSFIQVIPDGQFEALADDFFGELDNQGELIIGSGMDSLVDRNSITIVNQTHERKFFMYLRASCFNADERCSDEEGNTIGEKGVEAFVLRQFGLLMNLSPVNCENSPSNIMCTIPSNSQGDSFNVDQIFASMNSSLNSIEDNPNFYNDAEKTASCLHKPWIDKDVYFAKQEGVPENEDSYYNGVFQKEEIQNALDEIACNTLLGCGYFNYLEVNDKEEIPFVLERQDNTQDVVKSSIQIWPDAVFNNFVLEDLGTAVPDPNGVTAINAAKKSNFQMILRSSCFSQDERCSGNNLGISENGVKAFVARQLGFAIGLFSKNCNDFPDDVMCANFPDDSQWSSESRFIYYNKLNNFLELTGNNPYFYNQYFEESEVE